MRGEWYHDDLSPIIQGITMLRQQMEELKTANQKDNSKPSLKEVVQTKETRVREPQPGHTVTRRGNRRRRHTNVKGAMKIMSTIVNIVSNVVVMTIRKGSVHKKTGFGSRI